MSDHDEIGGLIARYCWHVDHGEWDPWIALFTDTGTWRSGDLGPFEGREQLAELGGILAARIAGAVSRHVITNAIIEVDGAAARWRGYMHLLRAATKDIATLGEYDIALRKGADGWRIDRLEFTRLG